MCIRELFNCLNCIYVARSRFTSSRILFYMHDNRAAFLCTSCACRIERFRGSMKAEERENDEKQRALRGCGPNYPQWLSKTKKKNVSLGGGKDGASGFFSSFSFSTCQQPSARERVESILPDSFTSCSANGTSQTAVRYPAYSRIRVGETEMHLVLLRDFFEFREICILMIFRTSLFQVATKILQTYTDIWYNFKKFRLNYFIAYSKILIFYPEKNF